MDKQIDKKTKIWYHNNAYQTKLHSQNEPNKISLTEVFYFVNFYDIIMAAEGRRVASGGPERCLISSWFVSNECGSTPLLSAIWATLF